MREGEPPPLQLIVLTNFNKVGADLGIIKTCLLPPNSSPRRGVLDLAPGSAPTHWQRVDERVPGNK